MTPQDYEDTHHFILRNLSQITAHANAVATREEFLDNFYKMQEEFDYWEAYQERADLNFTYTDGKIVCYAYPVVNATPNYDRVWAVEVPITVNRDLEEPECHYCGQSDEEAVYIIHKPYEFEPASIVCEDCMEARPWK